MKTGFLRRPVSLKEIAWLLGLASVAMWSVVLVIRVERIQIDAGMREVRREVRRAGESTRLVSAFASDAYRGGREEAWGAALENCDLASVPDRVEPLGGKTAVSIVWAPFHWGGWNPEGFQVRDDNDIDAFLLGPPWSSQPGAPPRLRSFQAEVERRRQRRTDGYYVAAPHLSEESLIAPQDDLHYARMIEAAALIEECGRRAGLVP